MKLFKAAALTSLAVATSLTWLGTAQAQSVEEFYKGKTITLMVSASPGGSSDFFGRQLAMFWGKHIPGNPGIVVQNKSGAGGMVAGAELQNAAPKDGTYVGFQQRNNLYRPLLEGQHDKFDPREVQWIGSLNGVNYIVEAWHTSPVQTADEMFTKEMTIGSTGWANENRTLPALMNKHLGTKFKIIHGYKGSEEIGIKLESGELDGKFGTMNNVLSGSEKAFVDSGKMKIVFAVGWKNHPAIPNIPNLGAYVKDARVKQLFDFILLPFESGRPLAVPAGVPTDRVAALRKAFVDTMADPDFIAHMEKLNSDLDPVSGQRIEEIRDALYATPEDVLDEIRDLLKQTSG